MKTSRILFSALIVTLLASGCGAGQILGPTVTPTPIPPTATPVPPTATPTPVPTATPTLTPTPDYPPQGLGPTNFPPGVNPLTGLEVKNPASLERRPIAVKVENLPREDRPQWGLSKADINYEYYTEEGTTRFIAIFYGNDAELVGPVRSARLFDLNIVPMYKSAFRVRQRLVAGAQPPVQPGLCQPAADRDQLDLPGHLPPERERQQLPDGQHRSDQGCAAQLRRHQ